MTQPGSAEVTVDPAAILALLDHVDDARAELIKITQRLIAVPSETPPSDTREVARVVAGLLPKRDNVRVSLHPSTVPIENLIAVAQANRPGKRLILNGHLDTYPAGDRTAWDDDPFSGVVR